MKSQIIVFLQRVETEIQVKTIISYDGLVIINNRKTNQKWTSERR